LGGTLLVEVGMLGARGRERTDLPASQLQSRGA
jgi:hypothetical protein